MLCGEGDGEAGWDGGGCGGGGCGGGGCGSGSDGGGEQEKIHHYHY